MPPSRLVPDPYYGGHSLEEVLRMVELSTEPLVAALIPPRPGDGSR